MSTKKMHPPAVIHSTGQTGGKGSLLPLASGKTASAKDRQNAENIVPSQNGTASGAAEPQPNGNVAVAVVPQSASGAKKGPNTGGKSTGAPAPAAAATKVTQNGASSTSTTGRRKSHRNNISPTRKRQEQQIIFNSLRAWNVNIASSSASAPQDKRPSASVAAATSEASATTKVAPSSGSGPTPASTVAVVSSSSSSSNTSSSNSISGNVKSRRQQSVVTSIPVVGGSGVILPKEGTKGEQQKKVAIADNQSGTSAVTAPPKKDTSNSTGTACETGGKVDESVASDAAKEDKTLLNANGSFRTASAPSQSSSHTPSSPSSSFMSSGSGSLNSSSSTLVATSFTSPSASSPSSVAAGAVPVVVSSTVVSSSGSSKHTSSRASNAGKVLLPNVNPLDQFALLQGKLRNSLKLDGFGPAAPQQTHHISHHHSAHNHQQQQQQQQQNHQQQQAIPSTTSTYSLDFLHYVGMRMSNGASAASNQLAATGPHFNYSNFNQHLHPQQMLHQAQSQQSSQQAQQQQQHLQRHYAGYYEDPSSVGNGAGGDAGPLFNGYVSDHLPGSASGNGDAGMAYCYSQNHQHNGHHHHHQHNHPPHQQQQQQQTAYGNGGHQSFHQNNNYQQHNRNYGGRGQAGPNGGGNLQGRKTWNNNNNSWHGGKKSNMMHGGGGKYGGGGIKGGPNMGHGGYRKNYHYYSNSHHHATNGGNHHGDPHQQQQGGPGQHPQDHMRNLVYIRGYDRGHGTTTSSQESTSRSPTPSPQSESPAIDTTSQPVTTAAQDEKSDSGIEDGASKKSGTVPSSSSSSSSSVVSIPSTESSAISSATSQNLELHCGTGQGYESDSSHSSSYNSHTYRHRKYTNGGQVYRSSSSTSSGVSSTATFPPLVGDYPMQSSASAVNTPTATASQQVADFFLRSQSYHGSHQNLTTVSGSASPNPPDSPVGTPRSMVGTQSMPMFSELFTGQQPQLHLHGHHLQNHHQNNPHQQPRSQNSSYGSNSSLDSTLQNNVVVGGNLPASASASSNTSNCSIASNTSSSGYGSAPTSAVPPNEVNSMQSGQPRRRFSGRTSPAPPNVEQPPPKPNRSSFGGGGSNPVVNTSSQQQQQQQQPQPSSPPSQNRKSQSAWNQSRSSTITTTTAVTPVSTTTTTTTTSTVPPPAQLPTQTQPPPTVAAPVAPNPNPSQVPPAPVTGNPTVPPPSYLHLLPPFGGMNSHTPADRFLARAHLVELQAPPEDLAPVGSKWATLSNAVWDKFAATQQTEHKFVQKIQLWRHLFMCIRKAFPRFSLYLVGSTISGFASDNSDVDMCLVCRVNTIPFDMRGEALFQLGQLKNYFMNINTYFEEFSVIQAKVPILRFRDISNHIVVDLNYNNCVGIRNTHLLYCYSQLDWRLRPLTLVVKLWAQHHNINDAKNMTISSYSLVLMVIHFLQYGVSPPILPCLHAMYPDKFVVSCEEDAPGMWFNPKDLKDCPTLQRMSDISHLDLTETMEPYKNENTQSLGELFARFLEYYANFDYSLYAISVRTASVISIESARVARSYKNDPHHWRQLCIEEPFDLTNTARSVFDADIFEQIKSVFSISWRRLKETNDLSSIFECDPLFIPVASTLSITS